MPLIKHKHSDNWFYRFTLSGHRFERSCKTTNKALAQRVERKAYDEALKHLELGEKEAVSVGEALEEYVSSRQHDHVYEKTEQRARKLLGELKEKRKGGKVVKQFGLDANKPFHTLADSDLQYLITYWKNAGNTPMTIHCALVVLNQAINLQRRLGRKYPELNLKDTKKANGIKQVTKMPVWLQPDQVHSLLTHCTGELRDLIVLLLEVGARVSEMQQLQWSQVDFARGMVNLKRSKTNNESWLHLTDWAVFILKARYANKEDDWVFNTRSYMGAALKKVCKASGVHATFHTFRKTHASRLVMAGVSIYDVQKVLGHSSVSTTATAYAGLAPEKASERSVAVLNKLYGNN